MGQQLSMRSDEEKLAVPAQHNESGGNATHNTRFWTMTRRRYLAAWLFMLPALVILTIFTFYPLVYGVILSLFQDNLIGNSKFVGFDNFARALQDDQYHQALIHSALYLLIVPFIQIAAIGLAVLVNKKVRGITIFRAIFYTPVITSFVAAALVWKFIYHPNDGLIDSLIRMVAEFFNGGPIHRFRGPIWLDPTSDLALPAIAFVTFWKGIGYYMVVYLAGLQSIPKELEEAGRLDGARGWSMLRNITIPLLMPSVALCTILSTIGALRVFDEVFVMSGGTTQANTMVGSVYIYGRAFGSIGGQFDFGYAAALSLILAALIWAFTGLNLRFFNKGGMEFYS